MEDIQVDRLIESIDSLKRTIVESSTELSMKLKRLERAAPRFSQEQYEQIINQIKNK